MDQESPSQLAPSAGQLSVFACGEMHSLEIRDTVSIGRGKGNTVRLRDDLISRRHCQIRKSGGTQVLEDLDSRNGTWLNGVRVKSSELKPGDVIDVGRCTLFYTIPEKLSRFDIKLPDPSGVTVERPPEYQTVAGLKVLNPGSPALVGADELNAILRDRNNLLHIQQIMKVITSEVEPQKTFEKIIDSAVELTNARRGFLLMPEGNGFDIAFARVPPFESKNLYELIDRDVVDAALLRGVSVRTTVPRENDRRSLLCIPCMVAEQVIGALYLDAPADFKEFSQDDEKIIVGFSDQAGIAIKNVRLNLYMKEKRALEKEVEIAGQIQKRLFPPRPPSTRGITVFGESVPAAEVGGDYYDFIVAPDGKTLWICIADVSGKGISAGLIMVMARSILRTLVGRYENVIETVAELNRLLSPDLEGGRFISMTLMRWNPDKGALDMVGMGHEHVLVYRASTGKCERTPAGGAVLGIPWEKLSRRFAEREISLSKGDQVLLYTDGVTDARNTEGELFGLLRLQRLVETQGTSKPENLVYTVLEKVSEFMGPEPQPDDITLVALQRT